MTTPFWCILVASLLPYVWSSAAVKARVDQFGQLDNRLPRAQQAQLEGWGARALGASANGFETFPLFAAAVIVAHLCGADAGRVGDLVARLRGEPHRPRALLRRRSRQAAQPGVRRRTGLLRRALRAGRARVG